MILKSLLNSRFLSILLDKKRGRNGYSLLLKRGMKVRAVFFENTFLNIALYWPGFYLLRIGVSVYEKDYVKKSGGDDLD